MRADSPTSHPRRLRIAAAVGLAIAITPLTVASTTSTALAATPEAVLPSPAPAAQTLPKLSDGEVAALAATHDQTVVEFQETTTADPTLWLDRAAQLYAVDQTDPHEALPGTPSANYSPPTLVSSVDPLSLHSLPGANRTLFLDFDGHDLNGSHWATSNSADHRRYAGWDPDHDGPSFSASERARIHQVWAVIAEHYSAYNIDVTTQDPGFEGLKRSSLGDSIYGSRMMFTDEEALPEALTPGNSSTIGLAYIGAFAEVHPVQQAPGLVFTSRLADPLAIARTAVHEAGHLMGLDHDTHEPAAPFATVMAPFLSFEAQARWTSSDLVQLGLIPGARSDDHASTATPVSGGGSGVIESTADHDTWQLVGCSDPHIQVRAGPNDPQLQVGINLSTTLGAPVALSDTTADGLRAGLDRSGTATGTNQDFLLQVGGTSTYPYAASSTGTYQVDVTGCLGSQSVPGAPTNLSAATTAAGNTTVSWNAPRTRGGTPITGYRVSIDGQVSTTTSADTRSVVLPTGTGRHSVAVSATNAVGEGEVTQVTSLIPPSAPKFVWHRIESSNVLGIRVVADLSEQPTAFVATINSQTYPAAPWRSATAEAQAHYGVFGSPGTVSVRLRNAAGTGPAAASESAPTITAPGVPTSVTATRSGTSQIRAAWRQPSRTGGAIPTYEVKLDTGAWVGVGRNLSFTSGTLARGLHSVSVRARHAAGTSATVTRSVQIGAPSVTSPSASAAKRPGRPAAPKVRAGTPGGRSTFTARWAGAPKGDRVTKYRLVVRRVNAKGRPVGAALTRSTSVRSLSLARPKGRYRVRLQARNSTGWSAVSAWSPVVRSR